jgi:predicted naringenin-chalcone synthase
VHPGGRAILDAVERAFLLPPPALAASRAVLREAGNMSSASLGFVLARQMPSATAGQRGLALAFGPGLSIEAARFTVA